MSGTQPIGAPNPGIRIPANHVRLVAHAATVKGDVWSVDDSVQTVGGVEVNQLYKTAAITNGDELSSADSGIIVVALEDVAEGAEGLFCLQGMCEATTDAAADVGAMLVGKAGANDLTAAVAGTKVVAYAVETTTGAGLCKVMFDGLNGLGIFVA